MNNNNEVGTIVYMYTDLSNLRHNLKAFMDQK